MGDNVYFQYDIEAIECLSDSRTEIFNRMITGVQAGIITVNEAREELGYSELDQDDMDEVEGEPPETDAQIDEEDSPDEG
jgi:phage portal protein BeeE